jgi:hypothetical protein
MPCSAEAATRRRSLSISDLPAAGGVEKNSTIAKRNSSNFAEFPFRHYNECRWAALDVVDSYFIRLDVGNSVRVHTDSKVGSKISQNSSTYLKDASKLYQWHSYNLNTDFRIKKSIRTF